MVGIIKILSQILDNRLIWLIYDLIPMVKLILTITLLIKQSI